MISKFRRLQALRHFKFSQLIWRLVRLEKARRLPKKAQGIFSAKNDLKADQITSFESWPSGIKCERQERLVKKESQDCIQISLLNLDHNLLSESPWMPKIFPHSKHLWLFHLHYMDYLSELSNSSFELITNKWIDENSPTQVGYKYNWHSYVLSNRIVNWIKNIAIRKDSFDNDQLTLWATHLHAQAMILEKDLEFDIEGNHLIKNIKALVWASAVFTSSDSKRWRRLSVQRLINELSTQVLADGFHYELSPAYHFQVLVDLIEIYPLLEDKKAKEILAKSIKSMAIAGSMMTCVDGKVWSIGDGSKETPYNPESVVQEAFDLVGLVLPDITQVRLPQAGYFGIKTSEINLIFDCGAIAPKRQPAHGHADALSILLAVRGKRLFVDQGVFAYEAGPDRLNSRKSDSHNTPFIVGVEQAEFWGSFRVGNTARIILDSSQFGETTSVASRLVDFPKHPNIGLSRKVTIEKSEITINDEAKGPGDSNVCFSYLVEPNWKILQKDEHEIQFSIGSDRVKLISSAKLSIQPTHYFPDFGIKESSFRILGVADNHKALTRISID